MSANETNKEHELSIPVDKNQWLIFNVDQMGETEKWTEFQYFK